MKVPGLLSKAAVLVFTAALGLSAQFRGGPPHDGRGRGGPPFGENQRRDGKWWSDPFWVRKLALTTDQQHRIEDIFQQFRLKLIDLRAALEKQEAIMDPLLAADHPQEARVLAQIDHIADARADLEKANARMLWGFRQLLSPEQWRDLQSGGRQ